VTGEAESFEPMNRRKEQVMSCLNRSLLVVIAVAMLSVGIGCKQEGPAEQAGKKVDQAVEKTGQAIEEAKEKVEDATEAVKEKVEAAVEKAKEATK